MQREASLAGVLGKVVVVTGGSAGIGRAIVEVFAGWGAKVVIAGRNLDAAQRVAEAVARDFSVETLAVRTDVSSPVECDALIAAAVRRFGGVDVLVNNAAWFALIPLLDASAEGAARMLDTNFQGRSSAAGRSRAGRSKKRKEA